MARKRPPFNPLTRKQWQEAADAAHFMLALDSCRQYGFITGGPEVNVDRCVWILEQAKERGICPSRSPG